MAVLAKIREEIGEVEEALAAGNTEDAADEAGDLMFAMVNLVRHLDGDAEATLRKTNAKFERRFASIEHALAKEQRKPTDATLAEMDALVGCRQAGGEKRELVCAGGDVVHDPRVGKFRRQHPGLGGIDPHGHRQMAVVRH